MPLGLAGSLSHRYLLEAGTDLGLWEAGVMLLLLCLKTRDTATGTVLCPMKPRRAHQKYNQQTLKTKQ